MPALSPWFLSFGGRAASEPFPLGSSLFQEGLVMRVPAFIEFTSPSSHRSTSSTQT